MKLCTAEEIYVEYVASDGTDHLTDRVDAPDKLLLPVEKELAKVGHGFRHELHYSWTLTQPQVR